MFENESLLLKCPAGEHSQQKWTKRTVRNNAAPQLIKDCSSGNDTSGCVYYVNNTQTLDEGTYECFEGNAVLLVVTAHVCGKY